MYRVSNTELFDGEGFREVLAEAIPGLGLRFVAKATGVHFTSLSRIARGKQVPSVETYYRLCRWLDLDPNQFVKANPPGGKEGE